MDSRNSEPLDEIPSIETPEDVAVLYSWANLHGAKYRDFSASRREYRAQLRHRAAEQNREVELLAQADAEAAASVAEQDSKRARQGVPGQFQTDGQASAAVVDGAAQLAIAERMEAARRQEAAAQADLVARREEREVANASASARRQASLYAEAETRSRRQPASSSDEEDVPGKISDPYTPEIRTAITESEVEETPEPPVELHPNRYRPERAKVLSQPDSVRRDADIQSDLQPEAERLPVPPPVSPASRAPARRPQGYRPDDASGVRQIYRPETDSSPEVKAGPRDATPIASRPSARPVPPYATRETTLPRVQARADDSISEPVPRVWTPAPTTPPAIAAAPPRQMLWANSASAGSQILRDNETQEGPRQPGRTDLPAFTPERRVAVAPPRGETAGQLGDPTPKRRRQDAAGYRPTDSDRAIAAYRREQAQPIAYANPPVTHPATPEGQQPRSDEASAAKSSRGAEPVGPAWIYAQESGEIPVQATAPNRGQEGSDLQQSGTDTLQRSRERVASRWYALKGVFEQTGQERQEAAPVRQKETRTPVLAVFSLAGGVGKTSLVATLGRSLSSLGEKVLLTDTTSHGLLPYYFGASELRQGTVRTFSPPSGSTDAPIYLVNYGVDQNPGDEAAQEALVEEISGGGRGTHRIVLDLTSSTSWVIRRMARLNPTVLVPVAPDMNSVISLQAIEKFFHGVNGADGTPLKFFYVLNQFDAGLPLHLDVREVLRRQLGDRLLPFVIRRAPAVSEALAEGMTIIDYSPEAPVAEDYMNLAAWLRAQSAPVTAGFRNGRWSER